MTTEEILALEDKLIPLPFNVRATIATHLGLEIACCPGCGCYIGAPYCHPADDTATIDIRVECLSRCPGALDDDA